MFTLFIANKNYSSWSLRPWVLMRELHIPFEERIIPFGGISTPDAFRSFSPTGKVPCLVDADLVIWDSLAISEYLAEAVSTVWPSERVPRAWARCAAAEMHSGFLNLRNSCTMNCGLRVKIEVHSKALLSELQRVDELWNDGLSRFGGPFLAGKTFTAVDAFFAPVAFRVQTYDPPLSARAREYVNLLLGLPSMKHWYEAALRETWRDEEHEAEARKSGLWLHDLRHSALRRD
ncbi:MAG: glutathione S-transferase family protein [Polaromonas sp.]|uniref:glutathione S-transferase family protein n=1 Tax=Polaromonas sp. TaxID=1869339 RepID=UPI0018257F5C|nr:glutathione S-transferase family protein [Polaromonas sp.]MBA3595699.1 glutathione S-transferase family protein [Polaromonas sp.]